MAVRSPHVEYVKSKLMSTHTIKPKQDWISDCINYFISQEPNISKEALYEQALEQFILADASEASNPVIPETILQKKEAFTLNGTFVLQMQFLIDIAESPYDQWRRLHNMRLDEVDEVREPKAFQTKRKRTLKLELTDGHKTVHGMEYITIPVLNTKIAPGVKLKITGPLQVVNHILLLGPTNLKIIGGNVEDLLIVNAYENVLLRALDKPTTNEPITNYNDEVPDTHQESRSNNTARQTNQVSNNKPSIDNLLNGINFDEEDDVDMDLLMLLQSIEQVHNTNNTNEINSNGVNGNHQQLDDFIDDDDEILAQIDIESIENTSLTTSQRDGTMEVDEIADEVAPPTIMANDLLIPPIQIPEDDAEGEEGLNYLQSRSNNKFHLRNANENSDEVVPRKIARVEPMRAASISDDDYKFKTNFGDTLVTIDQYLSLKSSEKMKHDYVIKGSVQTIEMKTLRIRDHWQLHVELGDSYSHKLLPVKLHYAVIETLAEATASEMMLMREESKKRPQIKEDITKVLDKLQSKLINLRCFMKIELKFQDKCELVELLEDDPFNNQIFSAKLKEEKLEVLIKDPL